MCGIVGYVGDNQAAPLLLHGLSKLEYRGYDSAGIAVREEGSENIQIIKAKGRLHALSEKTDDGHAVAGNCGIGHTRWATHGEPSETNAHPHCTEDKSVVLVHNGIIENYQELKEKLLKSGYTFYSETDTEIAAKLIDYYYKKTGTPLEAITRSMLRIRGSYAFGILFKDHPGKIFAARKDSPLIIGKNETGYFIASDVPAILDSVRNVYYIDNMEIAELTREEAHFYDIDRNEVEKELVEIKWNEEAAEKGGYEHFMLKEIFEQPKAVRDTMNAYIKDGQIDFSAAGLSDEIIEGLQRVYIVACGSAYHVGMAAKYVMESLSDIAVEVDLASEFRYREPKLMKDSMVIIISQSGETADSLAALRLSKEKGVPVLGIVNVVGSSIARESDYVLYTYAGPEIAVATTKAYSTQLIVSYLLAVQAGYVQGVITEEQYAMYQKELETLPDKIQKVLDDKERIQWFASKYANAKDVFFIGRGLDYAICLEGSLKMKEVSYIHSEAYAAGELKHGTISLIEDGTLVVGVLTQSRLFEKTVSNLVEVGSRGAYLMAVTTYGNYSIEDTADFTIYVPKTDEHFATTLAIIPLQLLGYYVSVAKGLDVDKPRNLAKSVTVE
ncbi:glutamine--fructose-6-phosphate transaminase (isomerizing) [Eubacterium sp. An11]|uniref:glutamine--fructose-6-phosphate transaminase (isomerizing) n=1 Tax=Eubacterium sp. An11 TaxID=1965542 RepID=UPI000B3703F7|nr:glutamine--fructose-6-phosphate transaminase (isomerizing) [Eubacterium sp. An11]OUQ67889.1 glutamine--fructose-6-phosphate transaminase (isomerizing) [Eubacterium sp. An11]